MNFLIAPNSFKECSDSVGIADLFYQNLSKKLNANFIIKPISDGGDGFLNVCVDIFNLKKLTYKISKPYNDDLFTCEVGYDEQNKSLFIESARVLGMRIIPKSKRKPGYINSKGLGDLLKKISKDVESGRIAINKIFIGIGGTGTNDLGLGAASLFGLKLFRDNKKLKIEPANYYTSSQIIWDKTKLPFKIISVIDVNNRLLGKNGTVYTYSLQKGATKEELPMLEKGFFNVINLLKKKGMVKNERELSGAGGGLAAGLKIFFNSETITSRDFILKQPGVHKIKKIDFVVTGEGFFDKQSLMEKGTGVIIDHFKDKVEKIFLCCGKIDSKIMKKLPKNVHSIEFARYFKNDDESIKQYKKAIKLASAEITDQVNQSVF